MLYVKSQDETWGDIIKVASDFRFLSKLEFPKISGDLLTKLVSECPRVISVVATNVNKEIDLDELAKNASGLQQIKLRSTPGPLKLSSGIKGLAKLCLTELVKNK